MTSLSSLSCLVTNVTGKNPHGNELYDGIWLFRGVFEVTMEVWAPRVPSTHPSTQFVSHFTILFFNHGVLPEYLRFSYILQASYFASQGFQRRDERSNMLLVSASSFWFDVKPLSTCSSHPISFSSCCTVPKKKKKTIIHV